MERSYNRDTSAYARLKEEVYTLLVCDFQKLCALLGNKLLVWCYNALSCKKRRLYKIVWRLDTAYNLNYNRDFGVVKYNVEVLYKLIFIRTVRKITQINNVLYLYLLTGFLKRPSLFFSITSTVPEPTTPLPRTAIFAIENSHPFSFVRFIQF